VSLSCGCCMELGKATHDTVAVCERADRWQQGVSRAGRTREGLSTVAWVAGGPVRSSVDASVMGAERRGRVVCGLLMRSTGHGPGGTV
jgi:hypothetical protein